MTLKAKTERLERELRVMGDRLRTLETRNKDLETTNREEWVRLVYCRHDIHTCTASKWPSSLD